MTVDRYQNKLYNKSCVSRTGEIPDDVLLQYFGDLQRMLNRQNFNPIEPFLTRIFIMEEFDYVNIYGKCR